MSLSNSEQSSSLRERAENYDKLRHLITCRVCLDNYIRNHQTPVQQEPPQFVPGVSVQREDVQRPSTISEELRQRFVREFEARQRAFAASQIHAQQEIRQPPQPLPQRCARQLPAQNIHIHPQEIPYQYTVSISSAFPLTTMIFTNTG